MIPKDLHYNNMRNLLCLFSLLTLFILFAGCSTQKDRFVNRAYHTINAKYNGFFNAKESYNEGLKQLNESHQDNYEEILDIFKYGTEQDVASIESNMDVAYEKSSIVIQRHSMNIRGVEHNKWIDDAYFLIARSHFFKRDYNLAILTFEYIIRQYDTPLKYSSKIWIAKANNAMGRYDDALQILEILKRNYNNGVLPEEYYKLFFLVYADHFYQQEKHNEAIPHMEKAIENAGRGKLRTRLVFILGQTYQETGNYANAQKAYSKVLELNPGFDMEFRARINMAMAYDPEIGGGRQIKNQLKEMLRSDRNRNYRDQIYFALGQLSENQGMVDEAVEYYKKSTQVSKDNDIQKGLSFLHLGQIHYDREQYYNAHVYYDSTTIFLPSHFDNIEDIIKKRNILNNLAMNIDLVSREDSLQHLASLPQTERNRIVNEIIAKEREKEKKRKEQELMQRGQLLSRDEQRALSGTDRDGGWYFYNPSAVRFGQTEFASRWGDRKLEDLWRISNKQTHSFDDLAIVDIESIDELEGEQEESVISRENYLANIPLSDEQLKESNERLIQAYYNKGLIYKNRLNNYTKAANAFEKLLNKFPDNEHKLYASYFLYEIYTNTGDQAKANMHKNKIINDHPETDFAKILSDPSYAETINKKYEQSEKLYKRAYNAYKNKDFDKVLNYCHQADKSNLNRELAGKFIYLEALTYGLMGEKSNLQEGLNTLIDNYEGTGVFEPAKNMLAYLDKDGGYMYATKREPETNDEDKKPQIKEEQEYHDDGLAVFDSKETPEELFSMFEYKPETIHFFVYIVNVDKVKINDLRSVVNNFNTNNYSEKNLSLSNVYLENQKQILTITKFENDQKALNYFEKLTENDQLSNFDENHITPFIISIENYPVFYQKKNVEEYMEFFNHYYIR